MFFKADWFFADEESEGLPVPAVLTDAQEEVEPSSQALLLDNISKYEGEFFIFVFFYILIIILVVALKDKEKNGALFSSIISAAQRKVKRKSTKGPSSLNESKEEVTSPNESGGYSQIDLKEVSTFFSISLIRIFEFRRI